MPRINALFTFSCEHVQKACKVEGASLTPKGLIIIQAAPPQEQINSSLWMSENCY